SMQPMRLRSVVLPLPDGPTIMEKRCRGISKLIPLIAGTSTAPALYVLTTLERRTIGTVDGADINVPPCPLCAGLQCIWPKFTESGEPLRRETQERPKPSAVPSKNQDEPLGVSGWC